MMLASAVAVVVKEGVVNRERERGRQRRVRVIPLQRE